MLRWIKGLFCKIVGHKWFIYEYSTGYWSYDIEMAGICERCGLDTHKEV